VSIPRRHLRVGIIALGRGGAAIVAMLCATTGCGSGSGPSRYGVSGTVTCGGQPVPAGEIAFEPDTSQGNSGPGAVTRIEAGRFRTESGQGVVGGAMIVRIIGFDGVAHGESLEGRPLFLPRTLSRTLPREISVQDFDIPVAGSSQR
jgi:hypothetical protein